MSMSIRLAIGSEVVLDSIFTFLIVFYDIGVHAITQYITFWIVKSLFYNIILGIILGRLVYIHQFYNRLGGLLYRDSFGQLFAYCSCSTSYI